MTRVSGPWQAWEPSAEGRKRYGSWVLLPPPSLLLPLPVSLLYTHSLPPKQVLGLDTKKPMNRTGARAAPRRRRCARTRGREVLLTRHVGASGLIASVLTD